MKSSTRVIVAPPHREVKRLEKGTQGMGESGKANRILKRHLEQCRLEERKKLAVGREQARQRKANVARVKALRSAAKARQAMRKGLEAKRQEALKKLPKVFNQKTCGQGHPKGGTSAHHENRVLCMQRLRLRSPPLPPLLDQRFDEIARGWSRYVAHRYKAAVGVTFLKGINKVISDLGECILPGEDGTKPPKPKLSGKGQADAFAIWVALIAKKTPLGPDAVVV